MRTRLVILPIWSIFVVGDAAHLAGQADDIAERDGVVRIRDLLSCGHDSIHRIGRFRKSSKLVSLS